MGTALAAAILPGASVAVSGSCCSGSLALEGLARAGVKRALAQAHAARGDLDELIGGHITNRILQRELPRRRQVRLHVSAQSTLLVLRTSS